MRCENALSAQDLRSILDDRLTSDQLIQWIGTQEEFIKQKKRLPFMRLS